MTIYQLQEKLKELSDEDLYYLIKDTLEERKVTYFADCAYESGYPTLAAKLAVMKQICCA
jgi:hypothetical protein